jgi:hypothetical protein
MLRPAALKLPVGTEPLYWPMMSINRAQPQGTCHPARHQKYCSGLRLEQYEGDGVLFITPNQQFYL